MITSMIFFPEKNFYENPADYGFLWEEAVFPAEDGVRLHGWFLSARGGKTPQPEKGTLLFFHGNAGNISGRLSKAKGWVERGFSVFLVDYRGYGKSEGTLGHEEEVLKDARGAWHYLTGVKKTEPSKIVLYGESLGTYPAIVLAGEHPATALLLEAPFTSFLDLAGVHYPFVPKGLLKNFSFSNIDRIGDVRCPVFILHGTRDEICPYALARKLFEKAPGRKEFFSVPGGMHNDLPAAGGEDYWQKPYAFLMKGRE